MGRGLVELLVAELPPSHRARVAAESCLEAQLEQFVAQGKGTRSYDVDASKLLALVAARVVAADEPVTDVVAGLDAEELFLACGCQAGLSAALAEFEGVYLPSIRAALAPMKLATGMTDEVAQAVRDKLLVAARGQPPRIVRYAGKSGLHGLVRVTAVRTALNLLRKLNKESSLGASDMAQHVLAMPVAPELELVKHRYREDFRQAFTAAIARLAPDDRVLLRLYVVEGMTLSQIGGRYSVSEATAQRWLKAIRTELGDQTRTLLGRHLNIDGSELNSIVKAVHTQVSVSFARLLDSPDDEH